MPKFEIGDVVYLRMRDDKLRGMVVRITEYPGGRTYGVAWGDGEDGCHYEMELTDTYTPDFP